MCQLNNSKNKQNCFNIRYELKDSEIKFILAKIVERGFVIRRKTETGYNNAVTASILEYCN